VADDITQWLEELGLGRYAQAFAENDIDLRALPHLSDDDLNGLGLSLGHRRILQGALKEQQETGQPAATQAARDIAQAGTTPVAERRQLTVMFCDMAGSTALSSRLDPEDYREVIRAYQDACAGVITRYDGYVAKFMGDGVLAYFGWPRGHEDDAGRALSAGLGVVEAVSDIAPADGETEPLAVRIGIATGPVVVGDIVGEGAAQEAAVTGETPNLAARLQEIAELNTIVIAATTHALAGGLFAYETLGGQSLKGIDGSTEVWRVVGERLVESRFAAAHTAALTPLIGRDEELELLSRRWERAKGGDGQVVLLSGEPGIGKSRLTRALQDWIGDEPHTRLLYQCSPHHTSSALYPIINQLEIGAQFETGDDANARLDKLEALLAQSGQPTNEAIPLIAALLSIPADERHPLPELTPQRQKDRTLTALVDQLVGLASQQPVLFVFEDAHWIDPTSLELLELVIERATDLPMLMVVTYRPEFTAPWVGLPHVTLQALNRLTAQDCTFMAERLIGERHLPPEILSQIAERTDGIPLFIEELTRSVVESGAAASGADGDSTANIVIPATLQDALEARFDRSPAVREVAQVGAAIGREFSYALLSRVVYLAPTELDAALNDLTGSGLIFVRGLPPEASYTFKHALVQDTAYDSMVRSKRQDTHNRIANNLIDLRPDIEQTAPETMAHHCTEAGQLEEAVDWWSRAGRAAAERFANSEAIDHFNRALAMLAENSDISDSERRELDVQSAFAPTLLAMHGFGSEDARQAFERLRELSVASNDTDVLFRALWGLWLSHGSGGYTDVRGRLVRELLKLAEQNQDSVYQLQARHAAWGGPFELRSQDHLKHIERGLAVYDPVRHVPTARIFGGHDAGVCGLVHAAETLWAFGRPEQAMDRCRQALELSEEISYYPPARTQAETWSAILHFYARDWPKTHRFAESAIKVGRECGTLQFVYMALPIYGVALVNMGEVDAGLKAIEERLQVFRGNESPNAKAFMFSLKAEAFGAIGRAEEAIALLDEALAFAARYETRSWEPNIRRFKGEMILELSADRQPEAEACFQASMECARRQDTKMWELRAATSLVRLWRSQGKTNEARKLLAPIYEWFSEGFDTTDLKEAKALLDESD
jgi:class 3 adenylate cyclase/predicted ATPase